MKATNLRLDETFLAEMKSRATELGMSCHSYMVKCLQMGHQSHTGSTEVEPVVPKVEPEAIEPVEDPATAGGRGLPIDTVIRGVDAAQVIQEAIKVVQPYGRLGLPGMVLDRDHNVWYMSKSSNGNTRILKLAAKIPYCLRFYVRLLEDNMEGIIKAQPYSQKMLDLLHTIPGYDPENPVHQLSTFEIFQDLYRVVERNKVTVNDSLLDMLALTVGDVLGADMAGVGDRVDERLLKKGNKLGVASQDFSHAWEGVVTAFQGFITEAYTRLEQGKLGTLRVMYKSPFHAFMSFSAA